MDARSEVLEEVGCVVSVAPGRAVVRIPRSQECAGCAGCSAMHGEQSMLAEVEDPIGAAPGDTVRVRTRGVEGRIKAALLLFGLPLLMLLAGAAAAPPLFRSLKLGAASEALSVLSGLLLMAAFFVLLFWMRRRKGAQALRSCIVEILQHS